jgi:hypothetical protein
MSYLPSTAALVHTSVSWMSPELPRFLDRIKGFPYSLRLLRLSTDPYRSLAAMALTSFLLCALFLASRSYGAPADLEKQYSSDILCACNEIAAAISSDSQVFFPRELFSHLSSFILMGYQASLGYVSDNSHPAPSASEESVCSVEPGSAEDVSKIVRCSDLTKQHLFPDQNFRRYVSWDQAERLLR